ncbi:MAG: SigB/SigF/SigG family RNA polymerase sigma factor [Clostridia bacterium]|nr:SigB/SigF/SigG family RNA polymerase sigma factor [Clostridia bacterium]
MKADVLELVVAAKNGDEKAFDELICKNAALVKCIVKKYMGRGVEYDDLYQLGCIGLIKCIKKFNTDYNVEFSTYAVPMIAGEIKRFLRDDGTVKVSRSLKELAVRVDRARRELASKNGCEPNLSQIAEVLNTDTESIIMALDAVKPCVSIYEPIYDENSDACLIEKMEDAKDPMHDAINRIMLKEMLSTLSDDERKLIMLRYFKDMTQSQTARIMNISQVQVSRTEAKIMKKLKSTY